MVSSHSTTALLATIASVFFVSVNGHMIMKTPVPYSNDTLNNSPLVADGSDFPCKLRSNTYTVDTENDMTIGQSYPLSFIGSATHGGGSCQLSLTTDRQPTKDSKFEVIHSIEGGCPANASGNLGDDPDSTGASVFQFSIPDGVAPGQYTLAWTWFNKIGNREMYMNCAPVTVKAASSKRSEDFSAAPISILSERDSSSFPAMFVANIAGVSDGCGTTEGVDVQFPDPGPSVQTVAGSTFGPPTGCSSSSNSSSGDASSISATAAASSAAATGSASGSASTSAGGFASGAASSGSTATSSAIVVTPTTASSSSAAESSPAATATAESSSSPSSVAAGSGNSSSSSSSSSPSSSSSSSSSSSGSESGACSDEGAWSCSADGSSFQRCASGQWSASIPMASGTKCSPGVSDNLNMTAGKRSVRFGPGHAHVRRSRHAWGL